MWWIIAISCLTVSVIVLMIGNNRSKTDMAHILNIYEGNPHKILFEEFHDFKFLSDEEKVIVDVGCGDGGVVDWFHTKLGLEQVFGVDFENVIEEAKEKYPEYESFFMKGLGEEIPFDDMSVDLLIFRYSFHHVQDHKKTVNEIGRVLKQRGKVLFLEPVTTYGNRGKYDIYYLVKHLFEEEEKEKELAYDFIKKAAPDKYNIHLIFEKEFILPVEAEGLKMSSQRLEPETYSTGHLKVDEYVKKLSEEDGVDPKDMKFLGMNRLNVWERAPSSHSG